MNAEHSFIQEERLAVSGCADEPVLCINAQIDGLVLLGTPSGIACVDMHTFAFKPLVQTPFPVTCITINNGRVWAAGGSFAAEFSMNGKQLLHLETIRIPFEVLKLHAAGRRTAAVGANRILFLDENREELEGPPAAVVSSAVGPDGALFAASEYDLWVLRGGGWKLITPSNVDALAIRDIDVDSHGHVYAASPHGLYVVSSGFAEHIGGAEGLPCEDVRFVRTAGGELLLGTAIGAAVCRLGRWRLYAGKRWLPSDEVKCLSVDAEGRLWIGTANGVSAVERREMTLERKAALFLERLRARHVRQGYVTSCILQTPGDVNSFIHEASDNDGLWTALYAAAESFRYAVTKAPDAKLNAKQSIDALIKLQEVTPIPGFPARAFVLRGEKVVKSEGEWHPTPDGSGEWKGDTSSDELDGHFFAFSVYYDLVAEGEEKQRVAKAAAAIADHLLEHGLLLVDVDGEHTTWGVFSPELLNGPWEAQRGLNSLEILSHLKTTYHITGDECYQTAYLDLVRNHHYALNTVKQKITTPGEVNHSDDELAFLAYYPLLLYETDPDLIALYRLSLERSWQIERPEACPLYNVIYAVLTGHGGDVEETVKTLQEIPMDLITWTMKNSRRSDITLDEEAGRFGEVQSLKPVSPAERAVMKWNGNPYRLDGGNDGREEDDGTFFLLPYWMGRYYRLFQ
ncbi:MAG: two-component regulator propeller domain-containing protein [Armatimonadota bacterium]